MKEYKSSNGTSFCFTDKTVYIYKDGEGMEFDIYDIAEFGIMWCDKQVKRFRAVWKTIVDCLDWAV